MKFEKIFSKKTNKKNKQKAKIRQVKPPSLLQQILRYHAADLKSQQHAFVSPSVEFSFIKYKKTHLRMKF